MVLVLTSLPRDPIRGLVSKQTTSLKDELGTISELTGGSLEDTYGYVFPWFVLIELGLCVTCKNLFSRTDCTKLCPSGIVFLRFDKLDLTKSVRVLYGMFLELWVGISIMSSFWL